jgi:hypothetical protein
MASPRFSDALMFVDEVTHGQAPQDISRVNGGH